MRIKRRQRTILMDFALRADRSASTTRVQGVERLSLITGGMDLSFGAAISDHWTSVGQFVR